MSPRVLVVSNFLSGAAIGKRAPAEDLVIRLRGVGSGVICASANVGRIQRLADMLWTAWHRRSDYDVAVVEVYSGNAFLWAEFVAGTLRRLRKPYVLALHGGKLPFFAKRHRGRVQRLLRAAPFVIAPSEYLARELKWCRPDIGILPNAIDIGAYRYRKRASAQPEIVWLRSFHEMYNPSMAVRVMEILGKRLRRLHLTMIGPDRGDGSLQRARRLARDLELVDRITFAGPVSKDAVGELLDRSDVFLNTTNVDNTPVSVLEAMASGLCVVTTDAGGVPFLVRHGENGLLAKCGDAPGMAACVERLLEDSETAGRISEEGRRTAEALDWTCMLPRWETLLKSFKARL